MSGLSEMATLQLSRPGVDASDAVKAAWHERRAVVLEHLAKEGPGTSVLAAKAAESAHRRAAALAVPAAA